MQITILLEPEPRSGTRWVRETTYVLHTVQVSTYDSRCYLEEGSGSVRDSRRRFRKVLERGFKVASWRKAPSQQVLSNKTAKPKVRKDSQRAVTHAGSSIGCDPRGVE